MRGGDRSGADGRNLPASVRLARAAALAVGVAATAVAGAWGAIDLTTSAYIHTDPDALRPAKAGLVAGRKGRMPRLAQRVAAKSRSTAAAALARSVSKFTSTSSSTSGSGAPRRDFSQNISGLLVCAVSPKS